MMIYPGAFNTTTGPLHWELLQRARSVRSVPCSIRLHGVTHVNLYRAVDNQIFVAMCSPARDMTAGYHAVSLRVTDANKRCITLFTMHSNFIHKVGTFHGS